MKIKQNGVWEFPPEGIQWKQNGVWETGVIEYILAPDEAHSLYVDITTRQIGEETGEIQEWEQPDATNPYNIGDKVIFEGVIYESTIDENVWSPTDYPQGWGEA